MIPRIEFVYSQPYDTRFRILWRKTTGNKIYPEPEKVEKYAKKIAKIWDKKGNKILSEIAKISKLKWCEDKIKCYIIGSGISFGDPLTMPRLKDKGHFIDYLTHELIHCILTQEGSTHSHNKGWLLEKSWKYIFSKYKNETWETKIHIVVMAIHKHLFLKFYTKQRMDKHIASLAVPPQTAEKREILGDNTYARAWEIVERDGCENIIREFTKRIKKK